MAKHAQHQWLNRMTQHAKTHHVLKVEREGMTFQQDCTYSIIRC
jgi:hypothetical protein